VRSTSASSSAVAVPRDDGKHERSLRSCSITFGHQRSQQLRISFDDTRLAPDLDAPPLCIVDEEQMCLGILGQVAEGDGLAVPGEIGEAQRVLIQRSQEAPRAAPMLDVGLALAIGRSQKEAARGSNEGPERGCDPGLPGAALSV
jgi:hypothetical protein